jgi:hypothetical protein
MISSIAKLIFRGTRAQKISRMTSLNLTPDFARDKNEEILVFAGLECCCAQIAH